MNSNPVNISTDNSATNNSSTDNSKILNLRVSSSPSWVSSFLNDFSAVNEMNNFNRTIQISLSQGDGGGQEQSDLGYLNKKRLSKIKERFINFPRSIRSSLLFK